jgi:PadR family transcriptional regulator PadR
MKNENLAFIILKSLEEHYLCALEICTKLKMNRIEFDEKIFYPTLSRLQLQNYLCCNWIQNENGFPVKYYHLTKNGLKFIKN